MIINCKSWHSLRYGTIQPELLAKMAKAYGYDAIGLTDINTVTGIYDFIKACQAQGVKPMIGMEFRRKRGNELCYVGYARNEEGFHELNQFLSYYNLRHLPIPDVAPAFDHAFIVYPYQSDQQYQLKPNEYWGIRFDQINLLYRARKTVLDKTIILQPITFIDPSEHHFHTVLRAIENNVIWSKVEQYGMAKPDEYPIAIDQLLGKFETYPQVVKNTYTFIDQCNFQFDFDAPKNKETYTGNRYSDKLLLESLAYKGMENRYDKKNKAARERVEKELGIIDRLGFTGYFLIAWDIIRYSKSRGFYHVGRGSGANSIVSYCLGITDVCPIELNLYFERFLNPARLSPPDFDIDWSWQERDDILDYIFKRFNAECTAFIGTIGTFKYRSTFRELGKVFGLAKLEIDKLTRSPMDQHKQDRVVQTIHHYANKLKGFPNLRSLHSCGILISEKPLTYYTALEMPPKGFQTAQFDMYIGEDIGFEKLDILSQRGIGHIYDCVQLVKENKGIDVNIFDLDTCKRDEKANEYLRIGKTLGCFYIESPAMRGLLKKLNCNNYETLVAASSVIRPGVAQSGMLREYVRRHNDPSCFTYPHPVFEEQLGETYGVMVFQEDVLKIAHHYGGLDLADADILRRAMSGKTRSISQFKEIKQRFFDNCKASGYSEALTKEVYRQIESFADYSFCKAHSASYSVESYQSLYLKVYYPLEFMVAVINNFGGFYRTEVYVHEARMAGATIELPCVNQSVVNTTITGDSVYIGFQHIKSLPSKTAKAIVEERERNGPYQSLEGFMERVAIGIEHLETMIFLKAFRFTEKSKQSLTIEARLLHTGEKPKDQLALFQTKKKDFVIPPLDVTAVEDAFDELEFLGFMVSYSPFELLRTEFRGAVLVKDFLQHERKYVKLVGYLICIKDVPTVKGMMNFGTWIDAEGRLFDTTHFPVILKRYPFKGSGCYLLYGKIVVEFGYPSIEIQKMAKLPMISDPRYEDSKVKPSFQHLKRGLSHDHQVITRKPHPSKEEVDKLFGQE
ncbi:MAG: DNA polymerase III subunit alpha [Saprospiraceae bacterium]|nr:DNA polymerase III subunit alpha [Saprospiraceae bacterium]